MKDLPMLSLMFIAGALLAATYLGGLWLTVRQMQSHSHPALLFLTSMVVRTGLTVAVFYFILGEGRWHALLAALAGFLVFRSLALMWVRRRLPKTNSPLQRPL